MGCGCGGKRGKKNTLNLNGAAPKQAAPRKLALAADASKVEIFATDAEKDHVNYDYTITTPNTKGPGVFTLGTISFGPLDDPSDLRPEHFLQVVADHLEGIQESSSASLEFQNALDNVHAALAHLQDGK